MEVLQAKNLKKIYGSGNNAVHALDGVDLSVKKGEFVAIVGTSGSGKSTLLHMLGGLDRPTSGTVMVDGQDIFSLKEEALTIFRRRKIGFVFQSYNLVPVLNVYENIILPTELDGGKVNKAFVQQIVQTLGLSDRLDALPNQLSGGQQQRVAIARAAGGACSCVRGGAVLEPLPVWTEAESGGPETAGVAAGGNGPRRADPGHPGPYGR